MSSSKKIVGGAALIAAAIVVRTIMRVVRSRRRRVSESLVVPAPPAPRPRAVSTAPGAYFPESGPVTLQNEEGAPSRADLGEPELRPR